MKLKKFLSLIPIVLLILEDITIGASSFSSNLNSLKPSSENLIAAFTKPSSTNDSLGMLLGKTAASAATKKVLGMSTDDLRALTNIFPIVSFFQNLPQALQKSQSSWDYSNSTITISNSTTDPNTGNILATTSLVCDLGFADHGDITAPIGFKFLSNKYYFNPGLNMLQNKDISTGTTEVKNLLSSSLRDSLVKSVSLLSMAKFIPSSGIGDATSMITTFFNRCATLYPQDIFALKTIQLIASAYKNSKSGTSYPRIVHIPFEMLLLMKRLKLTPDYNATMKLQGTNVKNAYQWDTKNIVFFQDPIAAIQSSILGLNESMTKILGSSIQLTANQSEWEKYGPNGSGPIPLNQDLINNVNTTWAAPSYQSRSANILDTLIGKNNFITYSLDEQQLFINTIAYHVSQRYEGLVAFSLLTHSAVNNSTTEESASNKNVIKSTPNPELPTLGTLDLQIITNVLNTRIPRLKQIITQVQTLLQSVSATSNEFLREATIYFEKQNALIDEEVSEISSKITNLLSLRNQLLSPTTSQEDYTAAQTSLDQELQDFASYILNKTSDNYFYPTIPTEQTIQLDLLKYLTMKTNEMIYIMNTKFRGDFGYLNNPLPLNNQETITQAMAIIFRAIELLQKADALFKVDTTSYKMYDLSGQLITVKGTDIHSQTAALSQKMNFAIEKNNYDLKNKSINSGVLMQDPTIASAANQLLTVQNALNTEYLHYVRQYNFDTRKNNPILTSLTTNSSTTDSNSLTNKMNSLMEKQYGAADEIARKNLEEFIKTNNLFGPNYKLKFVKLLTNKYLNFISELLSSNEIISQKQNELTTIQKQIQTNQLTINNNQASINDPENKDAADQNILQNQNTELTKTNTSLQTKADRLTQQIKNLTQIPTWVSKMETTINNFSGVVPPSLGVTSPNGFTIAQDFLKSIGLSSANINALRQIAADYFNGKTIGYENVYSVLQDLSPSGSFPTLSTTNFDSTSNISLNQFAEFDDAVSTELNNTQFFTKIVSLFSMLDQIPNSETFDKVTSLTAGIYSSSDLINQAIKPTATQSTSSTTSISSSTTTTAQTNLLNNLFRSTSPNYCSNINSFLAENLVKLFEKSSMASYLSLMLDPILIKTFGCNMATLLSQIDPQQKVQLQNELDQLLTESNNISEKIIIIPPNILAQVTDLPSLSELTQGAGDSGTDTDLNTYTTTSIKLPTENIGSVSTTLTTTNLNSTDGENLDNQIGLSVTITATTDSSTSQQ